MNSWKRRWSRLKRNKVLSLLGLATRAGKIKSGSFLTEQAVKAGKAYLVLIAGDASENTKKKLSNMCSFMRSRPDFTQIRIPLAMQ